MRKLDFAKLLNYTAVLGILSFTAIISLNVDGMVASHNIDKFKDKPELLDKLALSKLSIDALPAVVSNGIEIKSEKDIWYEERERRGCRNFSVYHFGYCSTLDEYGEK